MPLQTGELEIEKIEWELFDVVKCSHSLDSLNYCTVKSNKKSK